MSISTLEMRQRKPPVASLVTAPQDKQQRNNDLRKHLVKKTNNYNSSSKDCLLAAVLFIVSLPVRLKNISNPDQVVFDEVHYGQYASYYITQRFFFDIHPPLAKMLIAWIAWIAGYDGQFDFNETGSYPSSVPYATIRAFGALLGCLVVPLAFLTIRNAGHSRVAATITALAICSENGLITNNRLILLDSYLLCFIAFSIYAYTRFYRQSAFGQSWWIWLFFTGVGLGCAVSSKWVGLFTLATVGLSASKHLWEILGDIQITKRQYGIHLCARLACLCVIPLAVYLAAFYAHFALLSKPGPGDSFMEIETQNELRGLAPVDTPVPVAYGSLITMRHRATTGGYLHSHAANYAEGSGQQQVTLYPYKDENNWWRILKAQEDDVVDKLDLLGSDNATSLEYVRHGDLVRLEHVATAPRKLHSHNVPAPVTDTDYHFEVSGYGFENYTGDSNDFWHVQIDTGKYLEARRSLFRLEHINQDCHLYSTVERLPDWGFGQQEVSCIQEGLKAKTMWMIDETEHPLLPLGVAIEHERRPGFLAKLAHLHRAMWSVISADLLTDAQQQQQQHGVSYYWQASSGTAPAQIISLRNPIVFWTSTTAVAAFGLLFGLLQLCDKRGFLSKDYYCHFQGKRAYYEASAGFFALGWALHCIPLYYTTADHRQQHDYIPALYFAVLTLGVGIDLVLSRFHRALRMTLAVAVSVCIIYAYRTYTPIIYGEPWSVAACQQATLLDFWDLNCALYDTEASLPHHHYQMVRLDKANDFHDSSSGSIASENVSQEEFLVVNEVDDEYGDEEYNHDDGGYGEEEEEGDSPTEPPMIAEPEPEFVDGKEVYGDDDDDDDEYPKTIYGVDPEADQNDDDDGQEDDRFPLKPRDIPSTIHV
ncbi:hypothetical protein [Parasitella parasitica]|uniref:Dolichyl-phosphate-mannose--protein mannosyltransferase n=1 Tax=Parasitella parasitica TaxID=35722 RepID=A0A0B7NC98_9FUNG|nr:hypothetical protein [Parasitella parasitica]